MITERLKRRAPAPVATVCDGRTRYQVHINARAAGVDQDGGVLQAVDSSTGAELWSLVVYPICLQAAEETDTQARYIAELQLSRDARWLRIENEARHVYLLNLDTKQLVDCATAVTYHANLYAIKPLGIFWTVFAASSVVCLFLMKAYLGVLCGSLMAASAVWRLRRRQLRLDDQTLVYDSWFRRHLLLRSEVTAARAHANVSCLDRRSHVSLEKCLILNRKHRFWLTLQWFPTEARQHLRQWLSCRR